MSPNLHKYASRVRSESTVDYLELWPPVLRAMIPVTPTGVLAYLGPSLLWASELSAEISVAGIKSMAFLNALTGVVSFCSTKENLKCLLFKPFRKEVYATQSYKSGIRTASWWKCLMNSARDSYCPCLIFERGVCWFSSPFGL